MKLINIIIWTSLLHWYCYRYSRLESSRKYIVLKCTQLARRVCHSKIDKCELPYWNSGFVSVEWGGAQLTFCSFSPLLVSTHTWITLCHLCGTMGWNHISSRISDLLHITIITDVHEKFVQSLHNLCTNIREVTLKTPACTKIPN